MMDRAFEGEISSSSTVEQNRDSAVTTESSYRANNQVEGVEEPEFVAPPTSTALGFLFLVYAQHFQDCHHDIDKEAHEKKAGTCFLFCEFGGSLGGICWSRW
jgi:hypothetical protein